MSVPETTRKPWTEPPVGTPLHSGLRYGVPAPCRGMDVDGHGRILGVSWRHGATPDTDLERQLAESVKSLSAENRELRKRIAELEASRER